MDFTLTEDEKRMLLLTARETIRSRLFGGELSLPRPTGHMSTQCGAFVTLHKKGSLRGCIGHITGVKPLFTGIQELAVSAAFNDPRFPQLTRDEYPDIDIEISVLTPLKRIDSPEEIEVGKHGILMQRGIRSGVLLPQVATEQGWDRETFLNYTCRKAGLPENCWREEDTEIQVFSAVIFGEKDVD